ncbi:hypothetical protein B0H14DRAFT_3431833 [Mycena olivaceomarginata]|nr:hypothetical protein B0H14DRAFT_3431833 [Mycena olivaceomarginata]
MLSSTRLLCVLSSRPIKHGPPSPRGPRQLLPPAPLCLHALQVPLPKHPPPLPTPLRHPPVLPLPLTAPQFRPSRDLHYLSPPSRVSSHLSGAKQLRPQLRTDCAVNAPSGVPSASSPRLAMLPFSTTTRTLAPRIASHLSPATLHLRKHSLLWLRSDFFALNHPVTTSVLGLLWSRHQSTHSAVPAAVSDQLPDIPIAQSLRSSPAKARAQLKYCTDRFVSLIHPHLIHLMILVPSAFRSAPVVSLEFGVDALACAHYLPRIITADLGNFTSTHSTSLFAALE